MKRPILSVLLIAITLFACVLPGTATPDGDTPVTFAPVIMTMTSTTEVEPTSTRDPAVETATLPVPTATFELPLRTIEEVLAMVQPATPNRSDCESDLGSPVLLTTTRDMELQVVISDSPCPTVRRKGDEGNYFGWIEPLGKLEVPVQIPNAPYFNDPWITVIEDVDDVYGIGWDHTKVFGIGFIEINTDENGDKSYWILVP